MIRLCLLALLLAPLALAAENLYVSPAGDDANNGLEGTPVRTLERARDLFHAAKLRGEAPEAVFLDNGTYRLERTLELGAADAGLVVMALPGATPVLSGGHVVSGWTEGEGGVWKAAAPFADMRQFFVNGRRAQRARGAFPEGAENFGDLQFMDAEAGYTVPGQAGMADWRDVSAIEIGYVNSWSHIICKIARIEADGDAARIVMQQPGYFLSSRKEGVRAETPAYLENARELLDEPGEFYFDRAAHTLEYLPRDGEDMTAAECVVPVLERLVDVAGTLDAPAEGIRFEGVTFAEATWLTPNVKGLADVQANFASPETNVGERDGFMYPIHNEAIKSPANVRLHAAHGVVFERCDFTRLGGAGLDIECGSQDNVVSGCRFFDISGSAVQIGDVLREDHHPSDPRSIVKGNRVENCLIHDIGVEYEDSIGVFAGYTQETVIAHNEIRDLPYSGISMGWGWGEEDEGGGGYTIPYRFSTPTPARDNLIANNHIHDVMLKRNDGGGIYMLGNQPGTRVEGNHIHDNTQGGGPGGIYLDEGSGFIEITGNCVYNVPTAMNYNNRGQDRIDTCNEHDNGFDIAPDAKEFPKDVVKKAGLTKPYKDLDGK